VNRKIEITYYWNRDSKRSKKVKPEHEEALEERALERISEMMKEGYSSGELSDYVRTSDKDGPDGVPYSGWWSANTISPDDELVGIISRSIAPFYYGGWDKKTDQPIWIKNPDKALKIPVSEIPDLVNKAQRHSRGEVTGIINPQ